MSKMDEIRKTGVLVFLLSLPVMIWRSGHIGRVITIFSTTLILLWVVGKTSDTVITQIVNKWEIRHESNKLFNELGKAKEGIDSVNSFYRTADALLRKELDKKGEAYLGEFKERYSKMEESIKQLELGISIVSERERGELKERIVELKEQIVVNKKSVDSKEERMKFESILSSISLLSADEKSRFVKDLKDAGFYVEQTKKKITAIRGGRTYSSMDVAIPMFLDTSTDVSMVKADDAETE